MGTGRLLWSRRRDPDSGDHAQPKKHTTDESLLFGRSGRWVRPTAATAMLEASVAEITSALRPRRYRRRAASRIQQASQHARLCQDAPRYASQAQCSAKCATQKRKHHHRWHDAPQRSTSVILLSMRKSSALSFSVLPGHTHRTGNR